MQVIQKSTISTTVTNPILFSLATLCCYQMNFHKISNNCNSVYFVPFCVCVFYWIYRSERWKKVSMRECQNKEEKLRPNVLMKMKLKTNIVSWDNIACTWVFSFSGGCESVATSTHNHEWVEHVYSLEFMDITIPYTIHPVPNLESSSFTLLCKCDVY